MKTPLLIVVACALSACASNSNTGDIGNLDETQMTVLKCPNGLADCYSKANKICGSRGFDELDRAPGGRLTSAGRLDNQGDDRHVYREDLRYEDEHQTLAIRCK